MILARADRAPADPAAASRIPVVLLHGLFGQSRNLSGLQRRLAADRPAVALDLRSHGRSPHAPLALDAMAEDVLETLGAIGLGTAPVHLLGHSLGGKVAMAAALLRPRAVSRLLVADIAPVAYGHTNRGFVEAMRGLPLRPGLSRAEADALLASSVAEPPVRDLMLQNLDLRPDGPESPPAWRIGLAEIARSLGAVEDWPGWTDGLRHEGPTLFLRGARSDYIRDAHRPAIARHFPAAAVETIEDAGHWLHAERPDAFAEAARAFLGAGGS